MIRSGNAMSMIVTKTGDGGKTGLFGGERVSKSHVCIEACGMVDELNAWIGVLVAHVEPDQDSLREEFQTIQSTLIRAGLILATARDSDACPISDEEVRLLETRIDIMKKVLPPLSGFILPGGDSESSFIHVARTVCRRTERAVVRLAETGGLESIPVPLQSVLSFLNRLSDYLFILARYRNFRQGIPDQSIRRID
jgi:cob(I)alamin adenosyltransferase